MTHAEMAFHSGKHPFYHGCEGIPKDKYNDIKKIKNWLLTQLTLPKITDEHIYMFLHSNYFDIEKTQQTIQQYFTVRCSDPDLFLNRSPFNPDVQSGLNVMYMISLPKTTPEGYKVLIFRLSDVNSEKFVHYQVAKALITFNDIRIAEDGIVPGYIIVADARGFGLSHLTKINLQILRTYTKYMQEAKPIRLKGLHVLYSAKIIDSLMTLAKPFLKPELRKLLKFHTGEDLSKFFSVVPQEIMPEDYGGSAESLDVLNARTKKLLETKYIKWIEEEEYMLKEAIKLRNHGGKKIIVEEPANTFRNLSID